MPSDRLHDGVDHEVVVEPASRTPVDGVDHEVVVEPASSTPMTIATTRWSWSLPAAHR
jgi:hypothetical protein